jgi:hypothetical protein
MVQEWGFNSKVITKESFKNNWHFLLVLRGTFGSAASLQSATALLLTGEAGISPGYLGIKMPLLS